MTWMYRSPTTGVLFPRSDRRRRSTQFKRMLKEVYAIEGRAYDIKNVAQSRDIVMIELVESYKDVKTGKQYRTPIVLVLKFRKGKVKVGRHYCDPALSHLRLSKSAVEKALAA